MQFADTVLRDFIYYDLSFKTANQYWDCLVGTNTQANLNAQKVKAVAISVPEPAEQKAIVKLLQAVDEQLFKVQDQYQAYLSLKEKLLERIFPQFEVNAQEEMGKIKSDIYIYMP
ncbi:restriction endonuclease subunit S [Psittacicella hinzii]|uniref:Type I restriction modification DNA specificity domain-containing protein n=1 Tax=Psittacicella hinzii TaxID=2028575 RepID=A0A3A1YLU7_9GAMM|nr:restriction endonuclease subunit S [Psittacicella hinzii]RIY38635.1 hypothetical protein CKF58_03785 [Psittacicella hinzii]